MRRHYIFGIAGRMSAMGGKRTCKRVAFAPMAMPSPIRNLIQTARFAYHFVRGRNELFNSQPSKAKEHFGRAAQLGRNNPLYAEALLLLADSQQRSGEPEDAAETAAEGLARMSESDTYTPDDVAYMRTYMARVLTTPFQADSSDAFSEKGVRPSLLRDFPAL